MKLIAVGDNVQTVILMKAFIIREEMQLMLQWIVKETAPRR